MDKNKIRPCQFAAVKSPSIKGSMSFTKDKSMKTLSFSPLEKIKEPYLAAIKTSQCETSEGLK